MKTYTYVEPRAFWRPYWMPGIEASLIGALVNDDCIWRNGHGKVMIVGFGIMSEDEFNESFKCEEDVCEND